MHFAYFGVFDQTCLGKSIYSLAADYLSSGAVVNIGYVAPDFKLVGSGVKKHTIKEFAGKLLVLYFYQKDNTPGCTLEANGFNKNISTINKLGAEIVGIGKDSLEVHNKFGSKCKLKFLLLSDPDSGMMKNATHTERNSQEWSRRERHT